MEYFLIGPFEFGIGFLNEGQKGAGSIGSCEEEFIIGVTGDFIVDNDVDEFALEKELNDEDAFRLEVVEGERVDALEEFD